MTPPTLPDNSLRTDRVTRWSTAIIIVIILVLYGQTVRFPLLQWDDQVLVTDNPLIREPSLPALRKIWLEGYAGIYMPLTYIWWLVLGLFQAKPIPWILHAGNLVLFITAAIGVLGLLRRILQACQGNDAPSVGLAALAGTLLWMVHPLQVESVAWVSEAKGLLSLALGVWAINFHLDAISLPGDRSARNHALAQGLFLLALLAKPWAVAVPFMAAVIDRIGFRRPMWEIIKSIGVWILLGGALVAITTYAQAPLSRISVPWPDRPFVACEALGFYIQKSFYPVDLAPDYGQSPSSVIQKLKDTPFEGSLLQPLLVRQGVFFALAGIVLWTLLGWRQGTLCIALYAAALLPVLGLIPFGFQEISTVADRYALSPTIALALAWSMLAQRFPRLIYSATVLVGIAFCFMTWQQQQVWASDDKLVRQALKVNPKSPTFLCNRSALRLQADDREGAASDAMLAKTYRPTLTQAYVNLAAAYMKQGLRESAIDQLQQILSFEPSNRMAAEKIVAILVQDRRYEEAARFAHRLVEIDPTSPIYRLNEARLRIAARPDRESIELLEQALGEDLDPPKDVLAIAQIQEQLGEEEKAIAYYQQLLTRDGGFRAAKRRLAWIYATCSQSKLRNPIRSLALARELTGANASITPVDLDILAAALAANGLFDEAISTAQRAENRALELADPALAHQIRARRDLYTNRQPFITPSARPSED
jgi:tetratricopeptide (TPR) repeat protein